jgi:16S rRNA (guanine527-N7)-methyltransferase
MNEMHNLLVEGLTALNLSADKADKLEQYAALLLEQNKVMNLTAITDPVEVAQKHMLDCAALLGIPELAGKRKLIDVGTGAGFPGVVLGICQPELEITLLDSLNKRLDWLKTVGEALNVPLTTVHARAEELGRKPEYREQFDVATARAVADLRMLSELCLPYVKVGGVFLAMKAENCQEEVDSAAHAIQLLGGRLRPAYTYAIPGTDLTRKVIVIEKIAPTPEKYPRRFAKIQKGLL